MPIHNVEVFKERNYSEDGVKLQDCGAPFVVSCMMLDLDAVQSRNEIRQAFSKACNALNPLEWTFKDYVGVERKSFGIVPSHRIDVRVNHTDYFVTHGPAVSKS